MTERAEPTNAATRAAVLAEALPYIQEFAGTTVVVKYGGHAMEDPRLADLFAQDVVLLRHVGINPVVVHGGGPQISDLMQRLGKEPRFVDGLRVTDAETVDIVRMALVGKVNRDIVASVNRHGSYAVGLSGEDAGLILVSMRDERLGFVGDVSSIDPAILVRLLNEELIPVVATVGVDEAGQAYNINADTVAGAIAEALRAEKLVYLTDVGGVYGDRGSRVAPGPSVAPAVVANYASDPSQRLGSGAPGRGRRPGRVDQKDRNARSDLLVIESASLCICITHYTLLSQSHDSARSSRRGIPG